MFDKLIVLLQFLVVAGVLPLVYTICGLWVGVFAGDETGKLSNRRVDAVPLVAGIWSLGFLGLVCWYLGVSFLWVSPFLLMSGVIILAKSGRARDTFWRSQLEIYRYYVLILIVVAAVPLPGIFAWTGDWVDSTRQASLLMTSSAMGGDVAYLIGARSPVSGFGGGWAYLLTERVLGLQAHFALVSVGMLLVLHGEFERFLGRQLSQGWKITLALSAPVLLHSMTMWSKPLMAACLILAMGRAFDFRARLAEGQFSARSMHALAFWLSAGLATHLSSVIYVPVLAPLALWPLRGKWSKLLQLTVWSAGYCVILGSLPEVLSLSALGHEKKVALNPSFLYREDTLFINQLGCNLRDSFTGWPDLTYHTVSTAIYGVGEGRVSHLIGWFVAGNLPAFPAGTILFCFLPFVCCAFQPGLWGGFRRAWADPSRRTCFFNTMGAAIFLIIASSILNPYHSGMGQLQTGLLPLQIVALGWAANFCSVRCMLKIQHVVQTLLLILGAAIIMTVSCMLTVLIKENREPGAFVELAGRFADLRFILDHQITAISFYFFPWLSLAFTGLAVVLFIWRSKEERLPA